MSNGGSKSLFCFHLFGNAINPFQYDVNLLKFMNYYQNNAYLCADLQENKIKNRNNT